MFVLLWCLSVFLLGFHVHFQVLKETLVRHGFTFESETDTEVIPKLAKFVFDKANEEGNFCGLKLIAFILIKKKFAFMMLFTYRI